MVIRNSTIDLTSLQVWVKHTLKKVDSENLKLKVRTSISTEEKFSVTKFKGKGNPEA